MINKKVCEKCLREGKYWTALDEVLFEWEEQNGVRCPKDDNRLVYWFEPAPERCPYRLEHDVSCSI